MALLRVENLQSVLVAFTPEQWESSQNEILKFFSRNHLSFEIKPYKAGALSKTICKFVAPVSQVEEFELILKTSGLLDR